MEGQLRDQEDPVDLQALLVGAERHGPAAADDTGFDRAQGCEGDLVDIRQVELGRLGFDGGQVDRVLDAALGDVHHGARGAEIESQGLRAGKLQAFIGAFGVEGGISGMVDPAGRVNREKYGAIDIDAPTNS